MFTRKEGPWRPSGASRRPPAGGCIWEIFCAPCWCGSPPDKRTAGSCFGWRIWIPPAVPGGTVSRWSGISNGWGWIGTSAPEGTTAPAPITRASGRRSTKRHWKRCGKRDLFIPASVPGRNFTLPLLLTGRTGRWSTPGPAAVSPRRRSRKKAETAPRPSG